MDKLFIARPINNNNSNKAKVVTNNNNNHNKKVENKKVETNKDQSITIQGSGGLSPADIENMIKQAESMKEADKKKKVIRK